MANEITIEKYLDEIFRDRHYCNTCGLMTQPLARHVNYCSLCNHSYSTPELMMWTTKFTALSYG